MEKTEIIMKNIKDEILTHVMIFSNFFQKGYQEFSLFAEK